MYRILFVFIVLALILGCRRTPSDHLQGLTNDVSPEPPRTAEPPPPPLTDREVPEKELLDREQYDEFTDNAFLATHDHPVSTFSIDADGASYANLRRYLRTGRNLPPPDAVRTEELINYFDLDYPFTETDHPISINGEVSSCPWKPENRLVRVGIEGRPLPEGKRPPANFVFLVDVSGSMRGPDRLGLLQEGFKLFAESLSADDRVAIVTYSGSAGVALPATPGNEYATIERAIDDLDADGSTAGAAGIRTAYDIAREQFIEGGNNRIVVGTDGDFNVGLSSQSDLRALIEKERDGGIYLTVLGVGGGNYNDALLEEIANHGNGTYEYIDNAQQLRKLFIYDYGKFFTVAQDVKVQVTFNPATVQAYRLIGYENRLLATEDFRDDKKDAGEIGAGQNVTALYEIVPVKNTRPGAETFTIDFRYKPVGETMSRPMELRVRDAGTDFDRSSPQMQFTASVAGFGMLARDSPYKGSTTYADVQQWLAGSGIRDDHGLKQELWELVGVAGKLSTR